MNTTDDATPSPTITPWQGVDVWRMYQILARRAWLLVIVFVLTVAGIAWVTIRQTKIYRAEVSMVIELNPPQVLKGVQDVVELGAANYWQTKEYLETQYQILKSRTVAERVVSRLGLDHDMEFLRIKPNLSPEARARKLAEIDPVERLIERIQVMPVKDSRVVTLGIEDTSPKRAADIANAIAEEFLEQNIDRKLSTTHGASAWLTDQLSTAKKALETSDKALYQFKLDHDVLSTSLEARQNISSERLVAISDQLTKVGLRRVELEARRDALKKILDESKDATFKAESFRPVAADDTINDLKREFFRLQAERAELAEKYLDGHPKLHAIDERISKVRDDIGHAIAVVLDTADTEFNEVVDEEARLRSMLESAKREALAVNSLEMQYDRLKREREENQRVYDLMLNRHKEVDIAGMLRTNNLRVLDPALPPRKHVRPNLLLNLVLGSGLGLLLGLLFVAVIERLDNTIKTQEDIEGLLGLPLLGLLPSIELAEQRTSGGTEETPNRDLFVDTHPKSSIAECARAIRTSLLFASPDRSFKVLLVASCGPREGKSTCSITIGTTMAQSGNRTLIIDGDLRRPRLHRTFGVPSQQGLSTMILGESDADQAIHPTTVNNLWVLPAGPVPPNPAELLNADRYKQILDQLTSRFDRVIIDSPPVGAVADGLVMSSFADGVVLVVRAGVTNKNSAVRGVRSFLGVKAHIYGAVLNDVALGSRIGQYYYYYRYGYYPSEKYGAAYASQPSDAA